ncbi:hypothetical protein BD310DRAFT_982434 [Dichomitus squalens]|uniref:Uncharacterized protein n=1 Tax=Dichomitus squalens TaxID=114155 RepID=A0A4Q9PGK0_9APHY|nr:hypothetical protein BD310DRAFT_982434 [Dichomitus squalens]
MFFYCSSFKLRIAALGYAAQSAQTAPTPHGFYFPQTHSQPRRDSLSSGICDIVCTFGAGSTLSLCLPMTPIRNNLPFALGQSS